MPRRVARNQSRPTPSPPAGRRNFPAAIPLSEDDKARHLVRGLWPGRIGRRCAAVDRTFKSEIDAKLFTMQILAKGWTASAGTLAPDQPKRVVSASQIERWADPALSE